MNITDSKKKLYEGIDLIIHYSKGNNKFYLQVLSIILKIDFNIVLDVFNKKNKTIKLLNNL